MTASDDDRLLALPDPHEIPDLLDVAIGKGAEYTLRKETLRQALQALLTAAPQHIDLVLQVEAHANALLAEAIDRTWHLAILRMQLQGNQNRLENPRPRPAKPKLRD